MSKIDDGGSAFPQLGIAALERDVSDIYICADYLDPNKPFVIERRDHGPVKTLKYTIARISTEAARGICGMSVRGRPILWSDGEPDWNDHDIKIAMLKAVKAKELAETEIKRLKQME